MIELKKSDSNEIERTLSIVVSLILLAIPAGFMLEWLGIIPGSRVCSAEIILVLGGVILAMFLAMYYIKKENRFFSVLDLLVLLVALSLILSTIFAEDVALAIAGAQFTREGVLVNLSYILLLLACSVIKNPKYRKWIYIALAIVGVFEVFMAVMQSVVHSELFLGDMVVEEGAGVRAYGTLMNQNTYGALMAMLAGMEYGLLFSAEKKSVKIIHGILALGFTYSVVLSGTRGAMVGLAGASLIFSIVILVYQKKTGEKVNVPLKKLAIVIACVVLAILLALLSSYSTVTETVDRVVSETDVASADALGSGRIGIWKAAWNNMFLEHPILGVGISNFKLTKLDGFAVLMAFVAHNEYLDILCSQGIVGLVTYVALMLYIFIAAMKRLKKNGIEHSKDVLGLMIAFTAYMITAIFGWRIIYLTPYFYVVTGLLASRWESKRITK